jgi:hypothetical protein
MDSESLGRLSEVLKAESNCVGHQPGMLQSNQPMCSEPTCAALDVSSACRVRQIGRDEWRTMVLEATARPPGLPVSLPRVVVLLAGANNDLWC